MINQVPDTTIRYIACFLTPSGILSIQPDDQGSTKAEARTIVREFAPDFPEGTRFLLKRVQVDYLEMDMKED